MARFLLLAAAAALPGAALAHHSFAMFDMHADVAIAGTVKSFQWSSPHSWIEIIVHRPSGGDLEWSVEMGAPSMLYRNGWRQDSVKPGDKVTVIVHPLRDGRPGGSLVSATLADGSKLGAGGQKPSARDGAARSGR